MGPGSGSGMNIEQPRSYIRELRQFFGIRDGKNSDPEGVKMATKYVLKVSRHTVVHNRLSLTWGWAEVVSMASIKY